MKKNKKYIWDYDVSQMNFDDPDTIKWYLTRKIEFGDWESIDRKILQKYLPELSIDPSLKALLQQFLSHEKTPHFSSKKISPRVPKK